MAHFVQMDNNNKVVNCIVIGNDDCAGGNFPESEAAGQEFIASLGLDGIWLQTSYNNNFRGMYASIGYTYDSINDVFVPEKGWMFDGETRTYKATDNPNAYSYAPDTKTFIPPTSEVEE